MFYSEYAPRSVVLQKGPEGYGFVLRGAKCTYSKQTGSKNKVRGEICMCTRKCGKKCCTSLKKIPVMSVARYIRLEKFKRWTNFVGKNTFILSQHANIKLEYTNICVWSTRLMNTGFSTSVTSRILHLTKSFHHLAFIFWSSVRYCALYFTLLH